METDELPEKLAKISMKEKGTGEKRIMEEGSNVSVMHDEREKRVLESTDVGTSVENGREIVNRDVVAQEVCIRGEGSTKKEERGKATKVNEEESRERVPTEREIMERGENEPNYDNIDGNTNPRSTISSMRMWKRMARNMGAMEVQSKCETMGGKRKSSVNGMLLESEER
ncbi:uncharacterized protein G2W53_037066 [Senna tora]|uniref:Uncharacterized protein n=1 Tax=Senna tora TaxID=362788 RepID=A0A834STN9_9FABA|nr:uncharacterized protein G2W53_037066 [Senna tora]